MTERLKIIISIFSFSSTPICTLCMSVVCVIRGNWHLSTRNIYFLYQKNFRLQEDSRIGIGVILGLLREGNCTRSGNSVGTSTKFKEVPDNRFLE